MVMFEKEYVKMTRRKSFKAGFSYTIPALIICIVILYMCHLERLWWRYFGVGFVSTTAIVTFAEAPGLGGNVSVLYSFKVAGETYDGGGESISSGFFTTSSNISVYYNPNDPRQNYSIYEGFNGKHIACIFGLLFFGIAFLFSFSYFFIWGFILGKAKEEYNQYRI